MQPVQSSDPQGLSPQQLAEQQAEAQCSLEVSFLLANLLEREQTTVKAIIASLYDVGSANLVNQRVRVRLLRPIVRPVLKLSKPLLIALVYRWVCKKCPALITRWLQRKVKATTSRTQPLSPPVVPVTATVALPSEQPQLQHGEIRRLRSQVRWTSFALAGVSATLAITITKIDLKLRPVESLWQSSATPFPLLIEQQRKPRP
jgi:hypothetical protein